VSKELHVGVGRMSVPPVSDGPVVRVEVGVSGTGAARAATSAAKKSHTAQERNNSKENCMSHFVLMMWNEW
jgi:hypothetical protein